MSFHFSPDQSERRSRTGLLHVSAVGVHGAAAKDSALAEVVCVVSRVSHVCVCTRMHSSSPWEWDGETPVFSGCTWLGFSKRKEEILIL